MESGGSRVPRHRVTPGHHDVCGCGRQDPPTMSRDELAQIAKSWRRMQRSAARVRISTDSGRIHGTISKQDRPPDQSGRNQRLIVQSSEGDPSARGICPGYGRATWPLPTGGGGSPVAWGGETVDDSGIRAGRPSCRSVT